MSFAALEIARSALFANRLAMDIAAQNVANANTPGYIRQRAILTPLVNASAKDTMLAGLGVQVAGVQRLRDQCLEAQINHQEGQLGQQRATAASLKRVEGFFPDLDDNGIAAALGQTYDALQRLQVDPGSITAREGVLFRATALSDQMHEAVRQLAQEQSVLEGDLAQTVDQVNRLLHQVAELNGQIVTSGTGPSANDLRVVREETIRQLAGLCGAMGLDQADGGQDVLLGGVRLVQGKTVTELTLVPDAVDPLRHQVTIGDLTDVSALSGRIAGDLQARDSQLAAWRGQLDELASTLADAFNTVHRQGFDLNGQPGGDFFTYDPSAAASTLEVSAALRADPRLLAAAGQTGGNPGDGTNAAALANVRAARLFAAGSQTAEEFHASLIYAVGAVAQRSQTAAAARETLVQSLDTQYANQAGVSLDEEAVDIMRFQQAYNAGIKLVQTALEMMDEVLALAR
jgi:flagellar hook-associated protein 1 FlgK